MTPPPRFGVVVNAILPGAALAALARRVEAAGFDSFYVADHLGAGRPDPFAWLAWIGASTTRLRLGTLVLANDFHRPALLARAAATLDVLTGGRFLLGLGTGWMASDYEALGIDLERPGARIDRLEATLARLRRSLTAEPATRPALLLGGGGRRMLSLAGRFADAVAPMPPLNGELSAAFNEGMRRAAACGRRDWIRAAAATAGRDEGAPWLLSSVNHFRLTGTEAEARTARDRIAASLGLTAEDVAEAPSMLVGTAPWMAERIARDREELGFVEWALLMRGEVTDEMLDRFAAGVISRLR